MLNAKRKTLRQRRSDALNHYAERSAHNGSISPKLLVHLTDQIAGNGEADAFVAAGLT